MSRAPLLVLLLLVPLAGCSAVVAPPAGKVDRRVIYQRIADALPQARFGWGDVPAVAFMSASAHRERLAGTAPPPPVPLVATERGFRVFLRVYHPRSVWIPYSAIERVTWSWDTFPNVLLAPLLVVPLQMDRATVVFDARQVPDLLSSIQSEANRLEAVSREIGLSGPWSHAQDVKGMVLACQAAYGPGRLAVHFDYPSLVPAWLPWGGHAQAVAEAFAWAAAHPDAPILKDAPAAAKSGGGPG